jgi:hypothetical protein
MDTPTTPPPIATVVPAEDDPRSLANIERRKSLMLAERDDLGRLLPGSVLPNAGRPVGVTVTTLARTFTERAINLLGAVMEDPRAPHASRVTAAQALLDRAWGKSPISIDLNARANFADFLRDMGIAARYQHDHPEEVEAGE